MPENNFNLLIWIPLLPLIGVFINAFVGHALPKKLSGAIASAVVFGSFVISLMAVQHLLGLKEEERVLHQRAFDWIVTGGLQTQVAFLLDPLSSVMILVVTGIAFLIHVYSTGYMADEPRYSRFFTYLNLFTFSMLILVLADNFLLMFVGWEGVGLCSYLLIGFWYEKKSAGDAGKKAFIVNRVGDFGFILGMSLIFATFKTLTFDEVFMLASDKFAANPAAITGVLTAICLLLFVGAAGKSAQIPLYVWLPDAMEGPTPVSALIHAATMVTAGVYMVARCHVLFTYAPTAMLVVAIIGAATAIFAATIGLVQNDIKRVLAYSTVSQLGYMFLACGVGAFSAGVFHLMTHAFFKALLFLGSGSVIHGMHHEQDMRKMGGLAKYMPVTYWTFWIGTLAIAGIPIFSGFFSKDEILWSSLSSPVGNPIFYGIGLATAFMTAFYMARLTFKTFHGEPRMDEQTKHHIHESPVSMLFALVLLAVGALAAGLINIPEVLAEKLHLPAQRFSEYLAPSVGSHEQLQAAVEALKVHANHVPHSASLEMGLMAVTVIGAVLMMLLAQNLYVKNPGSAWSIASNMRGIYNTLLNKYYVDEFYKAIIVRPGMAISYALWRGFDVLVIDGIVNGVAFIVGLFSRTFRGLQTGYVRNYAVGMLAGVIVVIYILTR